MESEYEPVLPSGVYNMSMDEIKTMFVDNFPLSIRRKEIFDKFASYSKEIVSLGVVTELWLDG
jgi:hypothetical protein